MRGVLGGEGREGGIVRFVLLVTLLPLLAACSSPVRRPDMEQCAKSCKDTGAAMKVVTASICECMPSGVCIDAAGGWPK